MNYIEIEKDNYIFARKVEGNNVLILKQDNDNLKFLWSVTITGGNEEHLKQEHYRVMNHFFNRINELNHDGHSLNEIHNELNHKRGVA